MKKRIVLVTAIAALILAGCTNPLTQLPIKETSGTQTASGTGKVRLALGEPGARTLLPSASGLYYTLDFTTTDREPVSKVLDATDGGSAEITITLQTAVWELAVKGYLSQAASSNTGNAVVTGSVSNIPVTESGTAEVRVPLTASSGGTGSLSYAISVAGEVTLDEATFSYAKIGGAWTTLDIKDALTSAAPISLSGGYYQVAVYLQSGETEAGIFETAHIAKSLETKVAYNFTATDFAARPVYTISGTIRGSDTNDGVSGASVQLKQYGAAYGDAVSAGTDGSYTIPGIWAGTYTIEVSHPDYATGTIDFFTVSANVTDRDLTLTAFDPSTDLGLYIGTAPHPLANTGTLALALDWLKTKGMDNTNYTILLGADESLPPWTLGGSSAGNTIAANGKTGVTVTLKGKDAERTVQLSGTGYLFRVNSGATLILAENINLKGINDNNASLVRVGSGATLELKGGAKISGNKNTGGFNNDNAEYYTQDGTNYSRGGSHGGGVYVADSGTFIMKGGEISGNTAIYSNIGSSYSESGAYKYWKAYSRGGGVYIAASGTFTMEGGQIKGNTVSAESYPNSAIASNSFNNAYFDPYSYGGGVYIAGSGIFTMKSGEISGNTASSNSTSYYSSSQYYPNSYFEAYSYGGGVCVADSGTFTVEGGEILRNSASSNSAGFVGNSSSYGGGVSVDSLGTFALKGGKISKNTASTMGGSLATPSGGGVNSFGTFIMESGEISENEASSSINWAPDSSVTNGGGVNSSGTFTMAGGTIWKNTASSHGYYSSTSHGGGVNSSGTFTMAGGEISGNSVYSEDTHYYNESTSYGGGVYISNGTFKKMPPTGSNSGIISGYDAADGVKNTATLGQAVYVSSSMKRDTTAGQIRSLDSAISGFEGGWEGTTYTVYFNNNGGDIEASPATKGVTEPAATIDALPDDPTRNGYTFTGWNTSTNGTGSVFTAETPVNASVMVYAQWMGNTYTVTFDKNDGGTEASPVTKTVTVPATKIDALPTAPARSGYAFIAWNTAPDGSGTAFTAATTVTGNITIYAQWAPVYTVTFDKNGGDTEANPATKPAVTTAGSLPAEPTRSGYAFTVWNTATDGSGTDFTAATTVTGNITVYAQWAPNIYTVTFDKNSGNTEASPAIMTVTVPATTINALPTPPTKSGYTFTGWIANIDGSTIDFTTETTVNADITVYARWTVNGLLSINIGFNNGVIAITGSDGKNLISKTGANSRPASIVFSVSGYTSVSWYIDGAVVTDASSSSITIVATAYSNKIHYITFRGTKDGAPYSQVIPFSVVQ